MFKRIALAALLSLLAGQGWAYELSAFYDSSGPMLLEGDGFQTVTVQMMRGSGDPGDFCSVSVTVEVGPLLQPVDDEATPGVDYLPVTQVIQLDLPDGVESVTATFDVTVLDDDILEPTEFFSAVVVDAVPIDCGAEPFFFFDIEQLIPIFDDDFNMGMPAFAGPLVFSEGVGEAVITVNRVGGTDGTLFVNYITDDGTATAGEDYEGVSGVLIWEEGDATPQQIIIPIIDDTLVEASETFNVILTISDFPDDPVVGTVTIIDNDGEGVIQFLTTDIQVGEDGGTATATVVRSGDPVGGVSVDFATEDGTATAGEDYEAAAGTLTWADGDASERTIVIDILPGQLDEESENFFIGLFNPTGGAVLGPNDTATVTISTVAGRDIAEILNLTPNQRSLANWFDRTCPALGDAGDLTEDQADLLDICGLVRDPDTTDEQVRQALEAINPEEIFAAAAGALRLTTAQHGNLSQRLNALRGGATGVDLSGFNLEIEGQQIAGRALQEMFDKLIGGGASADEGISGRWGAFINGRFSTGKKDDTDREAGFNYDLYGVTLGADYRIRPNLIVGAAAGFGAVDTDYRNRGGGLEIDSWNVSAFVTYFRDDSFFLDAMATYGRNDYDSKRHIRFEGAGGSVDRTAVGDTEGRQYSLGLGTGWDFSRGPWTYGPHLGLYHYQVKVDGFDERGAGGLSLAIGDQKVSSLTANAGGHVSYAWLTGWGVLIPNARIDWVREFEDGTETLNFSFISDPLSGDPGDLSQMISLQSDRPDSSYLIWSLGVSAQFIHGISGFVNYQSYAGYDNFSIHEWNLGLRWEKTF